MDRRSFISAAILTAASTTVALPARAAADVDRVLARMTKAQKIALIRCDFDALAGLGIPALTMADSAAGIRGAEGVTAFPVPVAQAATFHPDLLARLGAALAAEGRGTGFTTLLSPSIDIARSCHAGRLAESMGEDPHLAGVLGRALTTAMRRGHTIPVVKHFAAYTQETDRYSLNVVVDDRTLHEVYYAPFQTILAAEPQIAVMLAYPRINGTFATQNPKLLDDLKRRLGLQGFTAPDFWAGDDQVAAANAGMDLAGLGPAGVQVSAEDLDQHVPADRIDDAARRILVSMHACGLFDHPLPPPADAVSTDTHRALAHEAAVHGTVLLSNCDTLPLAARSVAVIGPADTQTLTGVSGSGYVDPGTWTTPLAAIRARGVQVTHAAGSLGDVPLPIMPIQVTGRFYAGAEPTGTPIATTTASSIDFAEAPADGLPAVWSGRWTGTLTPTTTGTHRFSVLASGTATLTIDGRIVATGSRYSRRFFLGPYDYPLQGTIRLTAGRPVQVTVDYTNSGANPGESFLAVGWQPVSLIPEAVAAARAADAAVVVVNRMAGEGMDHASLALPGDQDELIAAVAAANPRTVVVLNTDGPVAMPWLNSVGAVLQTWYGGRGMGTALADILFGDADPAGRLPVTFPASPTQGPVTSISGGRTDIREGVHTGYRFYDRANQTPLFPFGHGLSYTRFTVGGLEVTHNGGTVTATVGVTNTGRRAGWHTVQLYAALPAAANAEVRRLVNFAKTRLEPGARTTLTMSVHARNLSVWNDGWRLVPGRYTFSVGSSSRDLHAHRVVEIS